MKAFILLALFVLSVVANIQPPWRGDFAEPSEPYAFTWNLCGPSSDPISIQSLSVNPSPLVLGKNITVSGKGTIGKTIADTPGYSVAVKIWRKEGVWIDIPCVDNVGSCTYDLCTIAPQQPCPPILQKYGIPCACPFKAGSYSLPSTSIETKAPSVSWLTDGSYSAQATLTDPSGSEMICLLIYAQLSSN